MEIFYHGTYRLFDHFDSAFLGQGEGKVKFGHGIYVTSSYATAALYAAKAGKRNNVSDYYVYTVEVPDVTPQNHLFSSRPVHKEIVKLTEKALKVAIPVEAQGLGKLFRKYVGNLITGHQGTIRQMTSKAEFEAEAAASAFLDSIGIKYLIWPHSQTKPDGPTNRAVLNASNIKILKIERVEVDENNKLIEGSEKEINL